jgi:hypothetical protein
VTRATVPPEITALDVLPGASYSDAYQLETHTDDQRSPAEWAADVFEGSPLRGFVRLGWRWGLLLRLAPKGTPGHVLGWTVQTVPGRPDVAVLAQESPLMSARLVFRAPAGILQFSTYVRATSIAGHVVWTVTAPLHRRLAPHLLKSAIERSGPYESDRSGNWTSGKDRRPVRPAGS